MRKSIIVLGAFLIIIVSAGIIYSSNNSDSTPSPSPTMSITTNTTTSTTIDSTPTNYVDDEILIEQLLSRYHECMRTKSLDCVMDFFNEDVIVNVNVGPEKYKFIGKSQVRDYYGYTFRSIEGQMDWNVLDTVIELNDYGATARTRIASDGTLGSEFFELVKIRGAWKIAGLTVFAYN